ncbi:MAG: hypothetical protein AAFR04_13770 [Pseudomonadota bacterium]
MALTRMMVVGCALAIALAGSACSNGGGNVETAALNAPPAAPKVNPRCYQLAQLIDQAKRDGTVARVEKAGDGKTRSVTIKRKALKSVASLNAAQAEFRSKCSVVPTLATVAPAPTAQAPATSAPRGSGAAPAAAAAAKAKAKAKAKLATPPRQPTAAARKRVQVAQPAN